MPSDKQYEIICSQAARIIRQERMKRRLSLADVAARAGLSRQMVSYVERELRNPTLDTMLRVCNALEINLADVIKRATAAASRRKSN